MNAKVALNLFGLKPREKLAKFVKAVTKCTGNAAITNPSPTLPVCTAGNDALKTILDQIDVAEQALTNQRITRDQLLAAATSNYASLGACVENKSGGDPAIITGAGFDVVSDRTPAPPPGQIMNLVLTHGDTDGAVDASWNREKSARSNEVQTSPDPLTANSWVPNQIATKSSCTIDGQVAGTKLWVRVRAIGADGPGLWSEPAFIIVS